MASLLVISNEIIVEVFESLHSIDDALRLGRSCRRLYGLLDRYRLRIMRSIILQSSIHKYDVRLCAFNDAYWTWTSKYAQEGDLSEEPVPPEAHPRASEFRDHLTTKSLSDQQVWDIVARWHGLAPLYELYLHPSLNARYREGLSSYEATYAGGVVRADSSILKENTIDILREFLSHNEGSGEDGQSTSIVHPDGAFEWFYITLTGYWLTIESQRFATICWYPLLTLQNKVWDDVNVLWVAETTLQESFVMLEIYDFVYDYLLRQTRAAKFGNFSEWVEDDYFSFPGGPTEAEWGFFLHSLRVHLSPADIIELLIRSSQWDGENGEELEWSPNEKIGYLRTRSLFDPAFPGQVAVYDASESADTFYCVIDLEKRLEIAMKKHSGGQASCQSSSTDYRRTRWATDVRGKLLSWHLSEVIVADRIKATSGGRCS